MSKKAQETRPRKRKVNARGKGPGGVKSKFKPQYVEEARKLAASGMTDREMAKHFGVVESTFYLWKIEHPEFSEATALAKEEADNRVERSLYHRAMGYSHEAVKIVTAGGKVQKVAYVEHYPPDASAAIFWLKNRRPKEWRDRKEFTGDGGAPLIPESSDVEIARRVAYILAQGAMKSEG